MTARVMTRLTLKTVTLIDICSMFTLFGLVFCIFNLKLKKKQTKISQKNAVIFYFQTKLVLNDEKLTYNIQNPRVVHDFRYWLTIQCWC